MFLAKFDAGGTNLWGTQITYYSGLGWMTAVGRGIPSGAAHIAQVRAQLEPHDLLLCLGADLLRMSVYSPVSPLPPQTARKSPVVMEAGRPRPRGD